MELLARHALPAFALVMLLMLAGITALWHLLRRFGVRAPDSARSPLAYMLAYIAMGFAFIVGAAAVFAEIARHLGDGRRLGQIDLLFSNTLHPNIGSPALQVFAGLTHLGDPLTLTGLAVAIALWLAWLKRFPLVAGWVLAVGGNALLNPLLKGIFQRARPIHGSGLTIAEGYSFPSGHSSGSVVAYGMLAYVLCRTLPEHWSGWRLPVVLLAAATAFIVCSSRVILQVHFVSDVLAGMASGSIWLALCIGAVELVRYRQQFTARTFAK